MDRIGVALLLLTGGCSLALDYQLSPESGDRACHDGTDDDQDGAVDCADDGCAATCVELCEATAGVSRDEDQDGTFDCDDEDCLGRCAEDTLDQCSDAQDDDGDGLVDWADVGCWPFADVEVTACTSVRESTSVYDFSGEELWAHPVGTIAPDPTGRFTHDVFVADGVHRAATAILQGDGSTGATAGTRADLWAYVDPEVGGLSIALVIADEPLDVAEIEVVLGPRRIDLDVIDPDRFIRTESIGWTGAPGWVHFVLEIRDDFSVKLEIFDGETFVASVVNLTAQGRLREAHRISLRYEARRASTSAGPLIVGEARVERVGLELCGYESPARRASDGAVGLSPYAAARIGADLCVAGGLAMTGAFPGAFAVSRDDGATFATSVFEMQVIHGLWARDDGARVLVGGNDSFALGVTHDCEHLELTDTFPWPGVRVGGYAFDGARHHVISSRPLDEPRDNPSSGTAYTVLGADGSIVEERSVPDWQPESGTATFRGNDVVLIGGEYGSYGRADVAVLSLRDAVLAPPTPLLALLPSHRAGACDELTIDRSVLQIDASPRVDGAAATGTFVMECPAPRGGITLRPLVVRAPR